MKDIKANNNKTDASFKDYFKLERQRQGMTQSDLAKNLRVSRQTVSHWENGIRIPDVSMLEAIADVLHTPVYRLLGGEEDEQEIEKKEGMEPNEIAKQLALLNSHYAEIIWEKKKKMDNCAFDYRNSCSSDMYNPNCQASHLHLFK